MATFTREDLRRVVLRDLPDQCDEELIHELCVQFGPIAGIRRPHSETDLTGTARQAGFCFVDFFSPEDAKYCYEALMRAHVKLFDKQINVFHASVDLADRESGRRYSSAQRSIMALHEVGAKVFVRNVDNTATEYEITHFFEQYGRFAAPPRMRRDSEGNFRGSMILSYNSFAASDRLIREMDQRVYRDRVLSVQYAELEDGSGRLHGSREERANADLLNKIAREHQAKIDANTAALRQQSQQSRAQDTSWAGGGGGQTRSASGTGVKSRGTNNRRR